MNATPTISRWSFLGYSFTAGAFLIGTRLVPGGLIAQTVRPGAGPLWQAGVYLGIDVDGSVAIIAHRSEMGTGIRTSLPMVVAEELEADWSRVRIVQAIGDAKYGSQNTDGSCSIKDFFEAMRIAGASARTMLEQAAAAAWKVPVTEVVARSHTVAHASSGRTLEYGKLVEAAAKLPVPDPKTLRFKPANAYRIVGKTVAITDMDDLVRGKGTFGIDARMPGMVYAAIARPPVLGSKATRVDDAAARKVTGVQTVVRLPEASPPYVFKALGGAAVIADSTWSALQGRQALKVDWSDSPNAVFESASFRKKLLDTVHAPARPLRVMGDVDAVFASGARTHEASYYTAMLAHAPMEPPAAVAEFRDGKVVTWAATQNPQEVQSSVADALGIKKEDVTCHVTLLGGAFGRKSKPDYVVEAALLSKQVGKPVKIVWSREDDLQFDYFHAPAAQYLKAAVGQDGLPTAILMRTAFPPIGSLWNADEQYGGWQAQQGWTEIPYRLANLRVENGPAPAHTRIGWLRSVASIHHAYAVQGFTDELAALAGADRVEYLLKLIGAPRVIDFGAEGVKGWKQDDPRHAFDTARLRRVTELVAEKSGWAGKKSGARRGYGLAAHWSFLSYIAAVVEVEVGERGEVTIPRVDLAVDAGTIVSPDRVIAQFEGAAVFGASLALLGEMTAKDGRIQQTNFDGYQIARINQAPRETHVHLVQSTAAPAGVGEPGVPPIAPALCNAIFAATGQRIRELPIAAQLKGSGSGLGFRL
ncbi:MAG TPA: molybdopterin cofactor-binding domain-containing protein [Vicinamibacterales bacterium]|nr:molybdopterin cofactor-binding domain-containing protein [Vicinamibacterales bacterium]